MQRLIALTVCSVVSMAALSHEDWVELFNGRDLDGWTAKITGYPNGENFGNTFRVEDGLLKVRYDAYSSFDGRFGHLFWKDPHNAYHLLIEYRFVGRQLDSGPAWAVRNSGVMLHAQPPASMALEQDFPTSVEFQLLGGSSNGSARPTGNLCTPGTDVFYQGSLFTPHCLNSSSETFDGAQWVTAEVIVRTDDSITHRINGEDVLQYTRPQLSKTGTDGKPVPLHGGFIALQSESHPVDFRQVKLKLLVNALNDSSEQPVPAPQPESGRL